MSENNNHMLITYQVLIKFASKFLENRGENIVPLARHGYDERPTWSSNPPQNFRFPEEVRTIMQIHLMQKFFAVTCLVVPLFLSGCANFLVPEEGALVWEDARIPMDDSGVQNAEWKTKDLRLQYSIDISNDTFVISGRLDFDRSLTDSYNVKKSFFLKMSFIDDQGQVLETADITPLLSQYGPNTQTVDVKKSLAVPSGYSGIVFNYYGVFRGDPPEAGDDITIYYFPYE